MQVKLLDWQTKVWDDPHRYKVLVCGRRAGKTTLSILKLLNDASGEESRFPWWYTAPTYRQAKGIAWNLLKYYSEGIRDKSKDNETELSIRLRNGNQIALKGLDNPKSLEGIGLSGIVNDELSAVKNWDETWNSSLRPMLIDTGGWSWFISKPRGYNHFHILAKKGDWKNIIEGQTLVPVKLDEDYITYRFTTFDNDQLPATELKKIEKEKSDHTADWWEQEYMARFNKYTGLVYKQFNRETHVIEPFDISADGGQGVYRKP